MSRAAVYLGDSTVVVRDVDVLEPGAGEVRIAVAFTGICGTDLHILHGHMDHRVEPPGTVGHEMSGRVDAVGEGVAGLAVGDPVTVMPLVWCGQCAACRAGFSHVCERLTFVGIDSTGAMQNLWTVPASVVVPLPQEMDLRDAALVEPTAVAVHDVRRSALVAGERVLVVGGGPVGVLIALVAARVGAEVVLAELDPQRRALAASWGIEVLDPSAVDVAPLGVQVVFEVSGSQGGMDTAMAALGVRGRLVVVGIHAARREVDLHRVFWRELTVLGARVYEREDYDQAIALLQEDVVPTKQFVSRVVPLDEAPEAFATLAAGGGVMKVLVDCRAGAAGGAR